MKIAAHKQRAPLHPLERVLLVLLSLELVFLPWAFGTRDTWSQGIVGVLALIVFGVSLLPRRYDGDLCDGGEYRLATWPRLLRFPLFWLGLALLAVVLIQSLNPAWRYEANTKVWWVRPLPHQAWLPSSVAAPFELFNSWRGLLIYACLWLTVCAMWVGVTRRRTLQMVLGAVLISAVLLALLGFAQRLTGDTKLLWIRSVPVGSPYASFVYQNHAGAYLGLVSSLGLAFALWDFYEGRRRLARSTPAAVWVMASIVLVLAVMASLSRGAVISAVVFGLGALAAVILLRVGNPVRSTTPKLVSVLLIASFLGTLGFVAREVRFDKLKRRFQGMSELGGSEPSMASRNMIREVSWDMLKGNWVLGTGAGSYRYLSPIYVKRHPDLSKVGGAVWWDHAHIDWLEIPIELGLAGTLLIAAGLGWCVCRFCRGRGWRHPFAVIVFLGCGQTLVHAFIDFPFQNPAILITWWSLLILSLRWLELDGGEPKPGEQR